MTRLCLVLLVTALATGCNSKSSTTPTSTPTPAPNPVFTSVLTPANEVPPVTNAESVASGTVRIELFITRDSANAISSATATFTVTLSLFPAGSSVNVAHIHQAPAGTNAGVLVNTGLTAGEVVLTNGAGGFTKSGVNLTPAAAQAMLDGPAGFYFNVHTSLNPGGAIRGQLTRTQ